MTEVVRQSGLSHVLIASNAMLHHSSFHDSKTYVHSRCHVVAFAGPSLFKALEEWESCEESAKLQAYAHASQRVYLGWALELCQNHSR